MKCHGLNRRTRYMYRRGMADSHCGTFATRAEAVAEADAQGAEGRDAVVWHELCVTLPWDWTLRRSRMVYDNGVDRG